jgi:hypothetical protein
LELCEIKPFEDCEVFATHKDTLAVRASKKLRNESQMVSQYAPSLLRGDIDKIPLWRGDQVAVSQVWEDYARYPYLPRVRNPAVILAAIRDGMAPTTWATDTFGYADSWDETKARYIGLLQLRHLRLR